MAVFGSPCIISQNVLPINGSVLKTVSFSDVYVRYFCPVIYIKLWSVYHIPPGTREACVAFYPSERVPSALN